MRRVIGVFVTAAVAAAMIGVPMAASAAPTGKPTVADKPLVISDASKAEAARIVTRYVDTQITDSATGQRTVAFTDTTSGKHHAFTFEAGANAEVVAPPAGTVTPGYQTEWFWWGAKFRLNRNETNDLAVEGNNAAILFAIGAAVGCGACAVGAAIEANWAGQARNWYNQGHCIHINEPYQTTGRTYHGTYNCQG